MMMSNERGGDIYRKGRDTLIGVGGREDGRREGRDGEIRGLPADRRQTLYLKD